MPDYSQLKIRLPNDLKAWLEEQAKINESTQNSEVVRAIRERMSGMEARKS